MNRALVRILCASSLTAPLVTQAALSPSAAAHDLTWLPTLQGVAYIWIGAACIGALIALAAVVVAQRLRNIRELAVLRHTLAASADWWWRADSDLTVREVQPSRRPLGWFDCRDLIGRKPWALTDHIEAPASLQQAVAAHAPFFDIVISSTHRGQTHHVTLSATPLFSATGSFIGYAGCARDLSELVATLASDLDHSIDPTALRAVDAGDATRRDELAQLKASFAERSRAYELAIKDLDSFAHSVSHDLRAPLRVVDGFAHIVLEDYAQTGRPLDDLGRGHLNRIINAGNRMNAMIETLLSMARMTGKELTRTHVDLSALTQDIADELLAQHNVATMHGTEHGPPAPTPEFVIASNVIVDGDPSLLGGVMQNLIGNAWKFSSKVNAPRIEFGVQQQPHPVYFVRDNGAGFDMRFADKLFGLFQRFHSANEYPGTGVGLATVQRIIRKHGGRIWAESEPGKGATFYFTLWEHRI